jgi:putative transposase
VFRIEAKMACFSFVEGWYNPIRLNSALGYRSPMAHEATMEAAIAEA